MHVGLTLDVKASYQNHCYFYNAHTKECDDEDDSHYTSGMMSLLATGLLVGGNITPPSCT